MQLLELRIRGIIRTRMQRVAVRAPNSVYYFNTCAKCAPPGYEFAIFLAHCAECMRLAADEGSLASSANADTRASADAEGSLPPSATTAPQGVADAEGSWTPQAVRNSRRLFL